MEEMYKTETLTMDARNSQPVRLMQTRARATNIAKALESEPVLAGFDFMSLVTVLMQLIPSIINCFKPDDGTQAQQYVVKRWDSSQATDQYGGYKKQLLKTMTRRAKDAGAKEGKIITWEQANAIALKTLDDVRTGSPQQISAIIREADFMLI